MCNYREDFYLKNFYREKYDRFGLEGISLMQVTNYENGVNLILSDHERAGGFITMDEQINKLKKDFKRFPEYFKLIIDKMVDQGLSFATNPSTNGWTTEMLLQKIRSRLYMENNGAEHHQTRDVIKKTNDPTPAMRANKFRNNNNNRKSIRIASRQGRYANQQNNQLAPNNAFAKRDNGLVVPRPNPYKMYNTRSSFKKKFINPNNYVGKKQQHGYANNINSLDPSSQSSSNNNSNQQTFAPQANYDIHGKNNKFPNKSKQVKFASKSPVGKKVGNYNNYGTGAGVKQPYSNPYCDICESHGHYHYQCANYRKNKDAKPSTGRTMMCLSQDRSPYIVTSMSEDNNLPTISFNKDAPIQLSVEDAPTQLSVEDAPIVVEDITSNDIEDMDSETFLTDLTSENSPLSFSNLIFEEVVPNHIA